MENERIRSLRHIELHRQENMDIVNEEKKKILACFTSNVVKKAQTTKRSLKK